MPPAQLAPATAGPTSPAASGLLRRECAGRIVGSPREDAIPGTLQRYWQVASVQAPFITNGEDPSRLLLCLLRQPLENSRQPIFCVLAILRSLIKLLQRAGSTGR